MLKGGDGLVMGWQFDGWLSFTVLMEDDACSMCWVSGDRVQKMGGGSGHTQIH